MDGEPWWDAHSDARAADAGKASSSHALQQPYVTIAPDSYEQQDCVVTSQTLPPISERRSPPQLTNMMMDNPANYIEICPDNSSKKEEQSEVMSSSNSAQPVLMMQNVNSPMENKPDGGASNVYIDVAEDNTGIFNDQKSDSASKNEEKPEAPVQGTSLRGRRGRGRARGGKSVNRGSNRGSARGRGRRMSASPSPEAITEVPPPNKRGRSGRGSRGKQRTSSAVTVPYETLVARTKAAGQQDGDDEAAVSANKKPEVIDDIDDETSLLSEDADLIEFSDLTDDNDSDYSPVKKKPNRNKYLDSHEGSEGGAKKTDLTEGGENTQTKHKETLGSCNNKKRKKKGSGLARLATLRKPPLSAAASHRGLMPFKREPAFIDLSDKSAGEGSDSMDLCDILHKSVPESTSSPEASKLASPTSEVSTCDFDCQVDPDLLMALTDSSNHPLMYVETDSHLIVKRTQSSRSVQTDYCPLIENKFPEDDHVVNKEAAGGTVDEVEGTSVSDASVAEKSASSPIIVLSPSEPSEPSTANSSALNSLVQMSKNVADMDGPAPLGLFSSSPVITQSYGQVTGTNQSQPATMSNNSSASGNLTDSAPCPTHNALANNGVQLGHVPGTPPNIVPRAMTDNASAGQTTMVQGIQPNIVPGTPPNLVPGTPPNLVPGTPPNLVSHTPPNLVLGKSPNMVPGTPPNLAPGKQPNIIPAAPPNMVQGTPPKIVPGTPPNIVPGMQSNMIQGAPPGMVPGTPTRGAPPRMFNVSPRGVAVSPQRPRQMSPRGMPYQPGMMPSPRMTSPRGRMRSPQMNMRFPPQRMMGSPRGGRMPNMGAAPRGIPGNAPPSGYNLSDTEDPGDPQQAPRELIRTAVSQAKPNMKTKTGLSVQALHLIPITRNCNRTVQPEYKILYMGLHNTHHRWLNVLSKLVNGMVQYQCGLCPRRFALPLHVHQHMKTDHCNYIYLIESLGNKPNKNHKLLFCRHCSFVTNQKPAIWYHFVLWHGVTVISQDMPSFSESSSSLSTTNADLAKAELAYMCLECKAVELNRTRLAAHVHRRHPNSQMLCGGFVRLKEVNLTKVNITGGNRQLAVGDDTLLHKSVSRDSFVCSACSVVHYREQEMIVHCMDMHSNQTLLYMCKTCEIRFDFQFDLNAHIVSQHKVNPVHHASVTLIYHNTRKNRYQQSAFTTRRSPNKNAVRSPRRPTPINSDEVVNIDDSDDELEVLAVTPGGSSKKKAPVTPVTPPTRRMSTPKSAARRSLNNRSASMGSSASSDPVVIDDEDELAAPLPPSPRSARSSSSQSGSLHLPGLGSPRSQLATASSVSSLAETDPSQLQASPAVSTDSHRSAMRQNSSSSRASPASSAASPACAALPNANADTLVQGSDNDATENSNHITSPPASQQLGFGDALPIDNPAFTDPPNQQLSGIDSPPAFPASHSQSHPNDSFDSDNSQLFPPSLQEENAGENSGYRFPDTPVVHTSASHSQSLSDSQSQPSCSNSSTNQDNSTQNALFDTFGPEPQAPTFTGMLSEDGSTVAPPLDDTFSSLAAEDLAQNSPLTTYCEAFQSFLSGSNTTPNDTVTTTSNS